MYVINKDRLKEKGAKEKRREEKLEKVTMMKESSLFKCIQLCEPCRALTQKARKMRMKKAEKKTDWEINVVL